LSEHLRFFHLTDPAISRKRDIEGQMVKTFAKLRVVDIEPLGRALPLYDITTGTGDFIANGVVSHNCFARPTHKYLDFDAGRDFEREIVVKVNAPELLRAELARKSWTHEHVALGTNTDPYQWVEGRYKLMPGIWEAMRDAANPCSVLTKSPLLLRDLALMKQIAERTEFGAALSVPTLDERAWRATEPHTPNPRARLEAVAELTRAGIRTGVLIAPLMPGINDEPEQVAKILELASEAGAAYVTGITLHLRGDVKGLFFDWLRNHRPDLVDRYRKLYQRGAYAPPDERKRLSELVKGPDLTPTGRMRGRYGPRKPDQEDANSPRNETAWAPDQGRLF
jgi:DNA repair photolyase